MVVAVVVAFLVGSGVTYGVAKSQIDEREGEIENLRAGVNELGATVDRIIAEYEGRIDELTYVPPRPIGVVSAFSGELTPIKEGMSDMETIRIGQWTFYRGNISGRDVVAVFCGVGKVNAAAGTELIIERFNPKAIIFSGIAGGVPEFCNVGDITISSRVAQHDYGLVAAEFVPWSVTVYKQGEEKITYFEADNWLVGLAWDASQEISFEEVPGTDRIPTARIGTVVTGDQFIASTQKCEWLYDTFDAYATEMEGGAVAQIAYANDVPWVIVRTHSDRADDVAEEIISEFWGYAAQNSAGITLKMIELWPTGW